MADATATGTRDVPALTFRASFTPSSVDAEKRTAEVVWTTGARVKRGGFWTEPFWEELSTDPANVRLDRLNNGAPLLAAHDGGDLSCVLGVVVAGSARLEKGKGVATVRFAKAEDDADADKVWRKVQDGILQNISVGYRVHKLEKIEDARARDDKTPVLLATDWEPFELSVVPMGADDGAGFRSSDGKALNPCVVITRKEHKMETEQKPAPAAAQSVEDITRAAAESREREAGERAVAQARETERALAGERERVAEIQTLVRHANLGDDLATKLIRDGAKIEDVRKSVLEHVLSTGPGGQRSALSIEAGEDRRDKFVRGGAASIVERAGFADDVANAKAHKRVGKYLAGTTADGGEFRGMTLVDLARASLERQGASVRGLHGDALVQRALSYRDAGENTTSDFTILLETAVNQIFLGRYASIPTTWQMWCARKSVQDFRTSTFYRPGTFGVLDSVTEAGEIKHKNIPDGAKATLTPATKANIIGISRKSIVNDRLSVFSDLASGLGEAAALTIESDAWALITAASGLGANAPDGVALFNAGHSNIGPTGAMSVTTLDGARAKMRLQKDVSSNQYLAIKPHCWLGPVELGGQIKVFNASAADPTDNKNSSVANRVMGLFDPAHIIDSPYLSASSAVRHYLLADPNVLPVFAVGFIDGKEAPVITSQQSFEYDGVQMKVVLDYGTAVIDYRGAVTCAGQ